MMWMLLNGMARGRNWKARAMLVLRLASCKCVRI